MSDIIYGNIIRCFFDQQTVMILFIPFFVLLFLFIYMTQILNIHIQAFITACSLFTFFSNSYLTVVYDICKTSARTKKEIEYDLIYMTPCTFNNQVHELSKR